jgi:hypothetical protein
MDTKACEYGGVIKCTRKRKNIVGLIAIAVVAAVVVFAGCAEEETPTKVPEDGKGLKIQYDFGNLFTKVKLASWEQG